MIVTDRDTAAAWAAAWGNFADGRRLGILKSAITAHRMAASVWRTRQPAAAADHAAAAEYLTALLP